MRKRTRILSILAICTLSLAVSFMVLPVDTHAQSSQASDQQGDRGTTQLAPQTGDIRAGRGTYFAVVRFNGVFERGSGVVGLNHVWGAGKYTITFNADISKCAYTASLSTHPLGGSFSGAVSVATAAEVGFDPRQVVVYTVNESFQSADRDFHLIVNCS